MSLCVSVLVYFPVYGYVICDHMRALHVYMSALNGSCPLVGIPCSSYEHFLQGRCLDCDVFQGTCPTIGETLIDTSQSITFGDESTLLTCARALRCDTGPRDPRLPDAQRAEAVPPHDLGRPVLL